MRSVLIFGFLAASVFTADSPNGRWDAILHTDKGEIPFRLDIESNGDQVTGTLYNGDETETTTSGSFQDGKVVLNLGHYLTKIDAKYENGKLAGHIQLRGDKTPGGSDFSAVRHVEAIHAESAVPDIAGAWIVPLIEPSSKGERAWRFVVKQNGAAASASTLRVDGDTGALTGFYQNGKFVLSHFDGSRRGVLEVTPQNDGSLSLVEKTGNRPGALVAYREKTASAKQLPEPADYTTHSNMRDPNEVFTYKFPDLNGDMRSNDDPKFKGKVVLAVITGTWCPNCHDEARYLVKLYKQYKDRGLEIVALDFEEPEQQDTLKRAHEFVAKYGVEYSYLIAGAPSEVREKVPQVVNLNTWPATLFIGRNGKVAKIHAGFASAATGEYNARLQEEFTSTIEKLLAEPSASSLISATGR